MKSNIKFIVLLLVLTTSCAMLPRQTEAQQTNVSFQIFYDQLSPYGQWVDYSNYGYVWIPDTGSDFVPYSTDGHWILTDYGWTWASDYAWGWATFHYGRWSFNDSLGWFWVPDNTWGPAWVNWRQSDGYYGWSPMEPGMSVSVSFGSAYDSRNDHWLFVRDRDFEREDIHRYYVDRSDRDRIVRNSMVINRTYVDNDRHATYVAGPTRESVQRATGRTIQPYTIRENNKPGQEINNGQLRIYRPQVEQNNSGRKIAPARVTDMKDVKRTPAGNTNQNRIGQPDNRVIPQNNNVPPVQQQNRNQQDNNKQVRQPVIVTPQNNNIPPVQQRNVNQQNNNRQVIQPVTVNPQNNNVPQVQQQNRNQQDNNRQVQQNRTVPARENQKIKTVELPKHPPVDVNRPDRQPTVVTPQNNNPQPVQQRNVNQQDNNRQVRQPAVANPQNNNVPQVQQQNKNQQDNKPDQRNAPPANNDNKRQPVQNQNINQNRNAKPAKQSKSIKQQIKKEQAKIPDAVSSERK
jgi:hypothetical protein